MASLIEQARRLGDEARQAVRRALAAGDRLSIVEIAQKSGLPETRARRAVDSLLRAGAVKKEGTRYRLASDPLSWVQDVARGRPAQVADAPPAAPAGSHDQGGRELDAAEQEIVNLLRDLDPEFADRLRTRLTAQRDPQSFRLAEMGKHLARLLTETRTRLAKAAVLRRRELAADRREKAALQREIDQLRTEKTRLEARIEFLRADLEEAEAEAVAKGNEVLLDIQRGLVNLDLAEVSRALTNAGIPPMEHRRWIFLAAQALPLGFFETVRQQLQTREKEALAAQRQTELELAKIRADREAREAREAADRRREPLHALITAAVLSQISPGLTTAGLLPALSGTPVSSAPSRDVSDAKHYAAENEPDLPVPRRRTLNDVLAEH